MEVVEFERDRLFGALITDGEMRIRGRAVFEALGPTTTRLTVSANFPVDASMEDRLTAAVQRSLTNIKRLMEDEG
jgi:hypothetical protein